VVNPSDSFESTWPAAAVSEANRAAARAGIAWLTAQGILATIDEIRADAEEVVLSVAPGDVAITQAVTDSARQAAAAADRARLLAANPDQREETAETAEHLRKAVSEARDYAGNAERNARLLAQLALGVTAGASASDEIERVERALVAVIAPCGAPVPLKEDGAEFRSRDMSGLRTELAGLITRLLLDSHGAITIEVRKLPARRLGCEARGVDILTRFTVLPLPGPDDSSDGEFAAQTRELGWDPTDSVGVYERLFIGSVTIMEPTRLLIETIRQILGVADPTEIAISVSETG
jgi:hypothetical protein